MLFSSSQRERRELLKSERKVLEPLLARVESQLRRLFSLQLKQAAALRESFKEETGVCPISDLVRNGFLLQPTNQGVTFCC